MANRKRRQRDKPPANVGPMVKGKKGLIIPEADAKQAEEECGHNEAAKRYAKEDLGDVNLMCDDCHKDVVVHTMNFVVLTPDKLNELKLHLEQLAHLAAQAEKRKKLGLVVPGQDGQPRA